MVLEMVRQLMSAVKDDSLPDEDADQLVGKLLVSLDHMMTLIDGDGSSIAPTHLIDKLEIEPPKTKIRKSAPQ